VTLISGLKNLRRMKIGIVDYGAGNINSVYNTIYNLGYNPKIIEKPEQISTFEKLIIPGVGSAFKSLEILKERGFFSEIQKLINTNTTILGICLGFQIFSEYLYEDGKSKGLNFIGGNVVPINNPSIFNIGWNKVQLTKGMANKIGIKKNSEFYFCHSYYLNNVVEENKKFILGKINFHKEIPSLVVKNNFMGVQFHPEKSQTNGQKLMKYFLNWEIK